MNLIEIIYKIKNYYNAYLTDEEYQILNNNPEESDIRKIVNKIWEKYLTNPFDYNGQGKFRYLVQKNNLVFFEPLEFGEYPVFQDNQHYLEILTDENILEESGGRIGFVVKVDWLKTNHLYLPIDLINGQYVKTRLIPSAVFCINTGEGKVDSGFNVAELIGEKNNLLFLDLNMRNYDLDYKIGLGDKERIINGMIAAYLLDKPSFSSLEEHMRLRKIYGSYIIKRYNTLMKEEIYRDDNFIKELTEYIDQEKITRIKF